MSRMGLEFFRSKPNSKSLAWVLNSSVQQVPRMGLEFFCSKPNNKSTLVVPWLLCRQASRQEKNTCEAGAGRLFLGQLTFFLSSRC